MTLNKVRVWGSRFVGPSTTLNKVRVWGLGFKVYWTLYDPKQG